MFTMIWERYFLKQFLSIFFLFLFCFYGLYILIDYASHTSSLSSHHIHWQNIIRYYFYLFASRAEILLPLALLLAFVKTVCTLNSHHELVALMASGMRLKNLMRPFLVVGFACMMILYLNEQFVLPGALKKLRRIEDATKHQRGRHLPGPGVRNLFLEDGTLIIYQDFDTNKERFFDVYWIQSLDTIYRMKFLSPYLPIPVGEYIDRIERQSNGELLQVEAFSRLEFPQIRFNNEILHSTLLDPELLSLTTLAAEIKEISPSMNEKESKILTAFYWKLSIPFLCLLAILAPAPFCVTFSRQSPQFLIYVCSLFGLIAFYMLMDAAQVIAKRQVIEPLWAICVPFFTIFGYFTYRYLKIETLS